MAFTKEEKDIINKAMTDVTTTFAIMSEPDKSEDAETQKIRAKLRKYADKLFDIRLEVEVFLNLNT